MNHIIRRIATTALTTAALLALAAPGFAQDIEAVQGTKTLETNPERSQIVFVSEAPAEKIKGTAKGVKGSIKINMDDVSKTSGQLMFPVKNMDTGNKMRDRHLQGRDWLNAKKNPMITFNVEGLKDARIKEGKNKIVIKAKAVGSVVVNGVTAPNTADVTITIATGAKKGAHAVKVEPKLQVALADHEVEGKRGVVGNKVGKTIDIEGLIYGKAE